jgi:hypothetical protein
VSFPQEGLIVSSKSFDQIERAMEIIEGDLENLVESGSEIMLSEQPGFFFLATVDGLGSIRGVPPQARIFQKKGGRTRTVGPRLLCSFSSSTKASFAISFIAIREISKTLNV